MKWAAKNGREACIRKLLEHGADPGVYDVSDRHRNNSGIVPIWTPLMCAAYYGHAGVAKLLIAAGANASVHGRTGGCPVKLAVKKKHADVLAVLVAAGADSHVNIRGRETLLAYAAEHGDPEIIKVLLTRGNMIDCSLSLYTLAQRNNALISAISLGHEDAVRVFVDMGTDINAPLSANETPLNVAAKSGLQGMVNLILDLGANIDTPDRNGVPPLHKAIVNGHLATVKGLLDRGASLESRNNSEYTPLGTAVSHNNLEIVELLLERNADTKVRQGNGDTLLLLAAMNGSARLLKLLLEKGADPSVTNKTGSTPLCLAVSRGNVDAVVALLDHEDRPSKRNLDAGRAYDLNTHSRIRFIDTPDSLNRTPLFLATIYGNRKLVRLLLNRGSNAIQTQACSGRSPLSFVEANKDKPPPWEYDRASQTIFDLLRIHDTRRLTRFYCRMESKLVQTEPGGLAITILCNSCLMPISEYDKLFLCGACRTWGYPSSAFCFECRAIGRKCHVRTDVPVG
ncbi:Ankyrin repeat protein [Aspergillus sclerotialis]|uniref:Ankyrin repeat protein n=1 Tax=Aspergillus sclerotialis TaxID=2070753 RepID=A0A3A2ZNI5_9EURO|nr:Ankyrin repeat protein [Aspergillus sclerotialis]